MRASYAQALKKAITTAGQLTTGDTTLNNGNNTITFPTQAAGDTGPLLCVVEPAPIQPGGSEITFKLKGVNGDTGATVSGVCPFVIPGASASTFVINVSGNTSARISFHRVQ